MTPRLRKAALTAHVTSSVGWLGAVAGFLTLAIAGLTSQNDQMIRAAYLAMELIAWSVIVPLAVVSLLTGLVSSLGTNWGLFRHHWVLVKFILTVLATIVLLLKLDPISYAADVAAQTTLSGADLRDVRKSLVAHAAGGLLILVFTAILGMYKPWGRTPYGRRKHREERDASEPISPRPATPEAGKGDRRPADLSTGLDPDEDTRAIPDNGSIIGSRRRRYVVLGLVGLVLLFIILHLISGGLPRH